MYNKIVLLGNVTKDAELRCLPGGGKVANTGIATNRHYKDGNGNTRQETMFIDVVGYGAMAEIIKKFAAKGSFVMLEGHLTLEQWTNKSGDRRSRHVVTVEVFRKINLTAAAKAETVN